jgi:hypothetical protein
MRFLECPAEALYTSGTGQSRLRAGNDCDVLVAQLNQVAGGSITREHVVNHYNPTFESSGRMVVLTVSKPAQ